MFTDGYQVHINNVQREFLPYRSSTAQQNMFELKHRAHWIFFQFIRKAYKNARWLDDGTEHHLHFKKLL